MALSGLVYTEVSRSKRAESVCCFGRSGLYAVMALSGLVYTEVSRSKRAESVLFWAFWSVCSDGPVGFGVHRSQ